VVGFGPVIAETRLSVKSPLHSDGSGWPQALPAVSCRSRCGCGGSWSGDRHVLKVTGPPEVALLLRTLADETERQAPELTPQIRRGAIRCPIGPT
jgi:hypothetical protein